MRGSTARQGLSLGWLLGLALLASCGTSSAGTTVESAASESTLPTTTVAASIEPTVVRLPPVELIAIDLECSSFTAPTLMDREVTVGEIEWAEEIGPMMGWSPELALRRTRFEEFLDSSLMSVLYESPRFAGAVIEPTDDYLGYTILKGVEASSDEFTEVFCQLPELQIRVGADSSTIDLSEAIDLLFDGYPGADGLVVGAGTDTQANGISLNATDVEAAEQLAVEFERDTGVRVTSIIYQEGPISVRTSSR